MIGALPGSAWAGAALAVVLFVSPGALLASLWAGRRPLGALLWAALAVALASAFWPSLLVLLHPLGVRLDAAGIRGLGVAALAAAAWLAWRRRGAWLAPGLAEVGVAGAVTVAGFLGLWSIRQAVAALGSDGYHHTLITQLILDQGGVPDNYGPYAPLVSFSYHFGSHAGTAVFAWLSGLPVRLALPIFGQVHEMAAVLSVAALTRLLTGRDAAAFVSAVVVGLVSVFPAFYINWSRYPQLAGLVLLPVFLGLLWQWLEGEREWRTVWLLGFLAAGLTLIHYRVVLMTAGGVLAIMAGWWLARRPTWSALKGTAIRLAAAAAIALALASPWLWQAQTGLARGFPVIMSQPLAGAFSLQRLGALVLAYPTNGVMAALTIAAVLWGVWRRERIVLVMAAWAAGLLVASGPQAAGRYMDTLTVFISLYVPAGVCIGWAMAAWMDQPGRWRRPLWAGLALFLSMAAIAGAWRLSRLGDLTEAYVRPADLRAAEWISTHTPAGARFLVNTFVFDFWPDYVVGSDAGTWLPLLAGRPVTAWPMSYPIERARVEGEAAELTALLAASSTPTSSAALAQLRAAGIAYVYLGERGGPLSAQAPALLSSPDYEVVYQSEGTAVLRLR